MHANLDYRLTGAAKAIGVLGILASVFFLALGYTMAFHGMYVDCFGAKSCALQFYREPTVTSALYGTLLGFAAVTTYHLSLDAFAWLRQAAAASRGTPAVF